MLPAVILTLEAAAADTLTPPLPLMEPDPLTLTVPEFVKM